MDNRAEIETKLGTLFAVTTGTAEYPGIWIGIKRGDEEISFTLVEVHQCEEEKPELHVHQWAIDKEGVWDDPISSVVADEQRVQNMFSKEE